MKELQPVNQNVLLRMEEEKEQTTASGIIIPDTVAKEKKNIAKVEAISTVENAEIAVGDWVMYKEFSGSEVEFEGNKFKLVPYADILAKVVETDEI